MALALVMVSVAFLLVFPRVANRRVESLRTEIATVCAPARGAAGDVERSLALQMAAVRGLLLTGRPEFKASLEEAVAHESAASRELKGYAERLGGDVADRLAEFERTKAAWLGPILPILGGAMPPGESVAGHQVRFQAAAAALDAVDDAIVAAEEERRDAIRGWIASENRLMVVVALLAFASAIASGALTRRLRLLTQEMRRERAALEASEEQFRALAENAQVAIFVIGEDDTIVFANPPVERIFGYKPSELVGHPLTVLMPEALRPRHRQGIERHIATGRRNIPWEGVELPGLRKDGVEIPLEITMGEFVRDGRRYFTGIARDITDRRRAEQDREDLLASEREARERAEAAIRTREEVLAIVSHDLRNPLNTIAMGATALKETPGQDPSRYVDMIQRAIQRMNRLIEDLMDVVKLEGGQRLSLAPVTVELPPLLGEICESFQAQAQPRNQTVTCDCDPAVPQILADRDRVLQVLSNLLGNALKFTPEGGRVGVQARRVEVEVWVSVQDSGPGIAPDDIPRLFDPYWQARRTARLGAGLGLTISKGIVEAHGGRIWVESRPGAGTTFTFALPIAGPQPAPPAGPEPRATAVRS